MQLEPNTICELLECKVRIEAVKKYMRDNDFVTTKEILALLGIKKKERKRRNKYGDFIRNQ